MAHARQCIFYMRPNIQHPGFSGRTGLAQTLDVPAKKMVGPKILKRIDDKDILHPMKKGGNVLFNDALKTVIW